MGRNQTSFKKGEVHNPGGRRKMPLDVIKLAREYTVPAMQKLGEIVTMDTTPEIAGAQVRAADVLLNRGWGGAPATLLIQGDVVHRKIIEIVDRRTPATVIDIAAKQPAELPA